MPIRNIRTKAHAFQWHRIARSTVCKRHRTSGCMYHSRIHECLYGGVPYSCSWSFTKVCDEIQRRWVHASQTMATAYKRNGAVRRCTIKSQPNGRKQYGKFVLTCDFETTTELVVWLRVWRSSESSELFHKTLSCFGFIMWMYGQSKYRRSVSWLCGLIDEFISLSHCDNSVIWAAFFHIGRRRLDQQPNLNHFQVEKAKNEFSTSKSSLLRAILSII